MGIGMVFMVLVWAGLIALAVWLVLSLFPRNQRSSSVVAVASELSALEILNRRFARGEISVDEYDSIKKALSEGPQEQAAQ
jgi:putative membrane protein